MGKRGPKSGIEKINLDHVKLMIERGFKDNEIAELLGVSERTYQYWKSNNPEFNKLVIDWKESADERVERSLWERANGYDCRETDIRVVDKKIVKTKIIKHYPPDPTSMIFWLKNRHPDKWRDKQDFDMTSKGEKLNTNTDTEIARTLAFLLRKGIEDDKKGEDREDNLKDDGR